MKRGDTVNLAQEQQVAILRLLRDARATVLRDSEAFHTASSVLEHVGQIISGQIKDGLAKYDNEILNFASQAVNYQPDHALMLFETVRLARNDAVHGGAYVRHLADRLVELLIVLEDAAVATLLKVKDIMVRDVVQADGWQNIAHVRRVMLSNAFSFIPVKHCDSCWKLIPVFGIVRFLQKAGKKEEVMKRMAMSIAQAIQDHPALALECSFCKPEAPVSSMIGSLTEHPVLVTTDGESTGSLQGIVTSFDLLSYSTAVHYISEREIAPVNGA